jgi:hypothetical protein
MAFMLELGLLNTHFVIILFSIKKRYAHCYHKELLSTDCQAMLEHNDFHVRCDCGGRGCLYEIINMNISF